MTDKSNSKQKICIIGDSHTGAFKLGWESIKNEFPHVEITFFAVGSGAMRHLKCKNSRLYFKQPRLAERLGLLGFPTEIDVTEYDIFLVVGMMNLLHPLILFQREHSLPGQSENSARQYVSEEMYIDAWQERFRSAPMDNVLSALHKAGVRNSYIIFKPLISNEITERPNSLARAYSDLMNEEADGNRLWSIVERSMKGVLGENNYIPQPAETTVSGLLTQERYSAGSTRLRSDQEQHDDEDIKHMNGEYGAVCLRNALQIMSTTGAQI